MTIQLHRNFRTKVAKLKAAGADDQKLHDTLAAFMDQHGVPVFLLEDFRDEPVIVALFAERGQRLLTPEQKAGLDAGTLTLSEITSKPPEALCPACRVRHTAPFHYDRG
jgi:hypothetical protein